MANALVYANCINWVFDTLVAATATGKTLAYIPKPHDSIPAVYLGDDRPFEDAREALPAIIVRLTDPGIEEDWAEIANSMRDGNIQIVVSFAIRPEDSARPYGSSTKRGYLTMAADIMNVLEAADPQSTLGDNAWRRNQTLSAHRVTNEVYIGNVLLTATATFGMGAR